MKTISVNVSKSPMKILAFLLSLALLVTSISGTGLVFATDSSAQADGAKSTKNLSSVINPDDGKEMFVVNSTFYDYYSDSQVSGASGTKPGAIDDGVYGTSTGTRNSFTQFNTMLYEKCKYNTYDHDTMKPLYCGLFFGDQNNSDNGDFYFKNSDGSNVAKNFWLGANSSQKGGGKLGLYASVNAVTQGLVDDTLSSSGNVTQEGKNLPYFDKDFLTGNTFTGKSLPLGEVKENVSFPFRTIVGEDGVPTYEFDSRYDTVRFNSNNQLDYLGKNDTLNEKVQVRDQKNDDGENCKPGFFPYNTPSDGKSTSLNYGFGVKLDIPFNMTSDGKINGQDIVFNFSGDDDVWVFIDGYLVLDLGGAHGRATGKIDFTNQTAYVDAVKKNSVAYSVRNHWYVTDETGIDLDVKTSFPAEVVKSLKNTSTSHTLTMFYMERGKIESNMMINFNLPQPNSLTVTNKITMDRVNDALKPATKEQTDIEMFSYDLNDQTDKKSDGILLQDNGSTTYTDQFKTGNVLDLTETKLTDKDRVLNELYDTTWDLNDERVQISTSEGYDNYAVSDGRSDKENSFLFQNKSDAPTTNLIANYVNDVLVGDLVFTKDLVNGVEDEGEEFNFKVKFKEVFGGPSKEATYEGEYTVMESDGSTTTKTAKNGIITLKAHQAAYISGVPVQTKYEIEEVQKDGSLYYLETVTKKDSDYTGKTAAGIISKEQSENQFTFVNNKSEIPVTEAPATPEPATPPAVTEEPTAAPTATPTLEPTAVPTAIPTLVPTPTVEPTAVPTAEPTPKPITPADTATEVPATPEPTIEPEEIDDSNNPSAEDEEEVEDEEPEEIEEEEDDVEEDEEDEEDEVEDVEVDADTPSTTPKTGDSTNLIFWVLSVVISAGAVIFTGKDLFWKKRER